LIGIHYPFVAVRRRPAALAASGVVCYNAGPRQFNSNESRLSGVVKRQENAKENVKKTQ
jgi:uncharacterized MAPEG superfamily protein